MAYAAKRCIPNKKETDLVTGVWDKQLLKHDPQILWHSSYREVKSMFPLFESTECRGGDAVPVS